MPIVEQSGFNWAKEIDEEDTEFEISDQNGYRTKIEYRNEDDKRFKITSVFRVDKIKVPKTVAARKNWHKFGDSAGDLPGVNAATTVVSDECFMQFLTNKEETEKTETVSAPIPMIKCRFCKGDHWSAKCPLKDILQDKIDSKEAVSSAANQAAAGGKSAYVPPSMRSGASASNKFGSKFDSKGAFNNKDDFTVRVTNLPEEATETDLMELFKPFGKVNRIFLAKDKNTQVSRGFAFVNFQNREDAQRAIWGVNDYGYNHLILKVEWAKPSKDS